MISSFFKGHRTKQRVSAKVLRGVREGWVRLWKGRGKQGERDKRLAEWSMQGGEGRRAEGKAAGESSAVMEERNGAMEGKERGGG